MTFASVDRSMSSCLRVRASRPSGEYFARPKPSTRLASSPRGQVVVARLRCDAVNENASPKELLEKLVEAINATEGRFRPPCRACQQKWLGENGWRDRVLGTDPS